LEFNILVATDNINLYVIKEHDKRTKSTKPNARYFDQK